MKKLLLVIALVAMSVLLLAEFTPYGSARLGWTFYQEDEDLSGIPDGRWELNRMNLQGNAHFGVDFEKGDLTAKVEIGSHFDGELANLRFMWGKYDFGGMYLLAGLDEDGFGEFVADQIFADDNGLIGYGALDTGRNPQIRFGMDNGFYAALINPTSRFRDTLTDVEVDYMLPKLNLGFKAELMDGDMTLHPSLLFQMVTFNEDVSSQAYAGESLMSFLLGVDWRWAINEQMKLGLNFHFGQNIYDMGVENGKDREYYADWNDDGKEWVNVQTLGGFLTFGYAINDMFEIGLGVGYASDAYDDYDLADTRMAFYLQPKFKLGEGFHLIPEFGMMMEMDPMVAVEVDGAEYDEGNAMYVGFQLRYDF